MRFSLTRPLFFALAAGSFLISCTDDEPLAPSLPDTYNFSNVDYSGQQQRIQMLDMLIAEVRKANDGQTVVPASDLIAIYENHNQLLGTSKKLEDKTHPSAKTAIYEYFNMVGELSGNPNNVVGGYLVTPEGLEPAQMIAKGLMGSLLYWQAVGTEGYLGQAKMNVDNTTVTEGQGTAMQHHWDEAFGYFGVPKDFPANDGTAAGATGENKAWFWGSYSNQRAAVVDVRQEMMDAFIKGRAAIDRKDMAARDEAIATIRQNWDLLVAANVGHYINKAIEFYGNSNETGRYYHNWSEGKAFAQALPYNPDARITATQYGQLQNLIGTNPQTATLANLQEAALLLQQAYGFTNDQMERL
ncbi:DUF4856 domain-containing protein [Cesiribacter andamanensis]|uniref:DUF4856 domain-containing protein n=1 Tax=Cesiribacter andamanensis AMV16 TaxID=1279009 RepID=M7NA98_9BACT|nr:DUF4856 domain-containing protein [Cesiribacter andamanensis]EMR04182.1 hypothetical protein ADICEAN_00706 [Cesiribacter andamanensis AMV16]